MLATSNQFNPLDVTSETQPTANSTGINRQETLETMGNPPGDDKEHEQETKKGVAVSSVAGTRSVSILSASQPWLEPP